MSSFLQRRPIQIFQQFLDARGVVVAVKGEANSYALDFLDPGDVLRSVWIPYAGSVLEDWPDDLFACSLLDFPGSNFQVSSQESEHLVSFG